jgi:hypothetical protein
MKNNLKHLKLKNQSMNFSQDKTLEKCKVEGIEEITNLIFGKSNLNKKKISKKFLKLRMLSLFLKFNLSKIEN